MGKEEWKRKSKNKRLDKKDKKMVNIYRKEDGVFITEGYTETKRERVHIYRREGEYSNRLYSWGH